MSETLLNKLRARNEMLHIKAVWQELHDHLTKFIDTDAVPAKMGITTEGEGMVVPQEIIEQVRITILTGQLDACKTYIDNIDKMKVEDHVEQEDGSKQKGKKKKAGKGRKGKGISRPSKASKTKARKSSASGERSEAPDGPDSAA